MMMTFEELGSYGSQLRQQALPPTSASALLDSRIDRAGIRVKSHILHMYVSDVCFVCLACLLRP